jgi:hypothetical protein
MATLKFQVLKKFSGWQNPKHEAPNPKQIRMVEVRISETYCSRLDHFEFDILNLFRAWCFEFRIWNACGRSISVRALAGAAVVQLLALWAAVAPA